MSGQMQGGERAAAILARVTWRHAVSLENLRARSKKRRITRARHAAMVELYRAGFGLSEIGRMLGGRHHTTVLAALRKQHPAKCGGLA